MKTLGEGRVRTDFNVSNSDDVSHFKIETAKLINSCESLKDKGSLGNPEKNRLLSLAQTAYEEAAMWAVKAATI